MENRTKMLTELGVELWFDDLSRDLVLSGSLKKMIEEDGVSGVTSNPTIFENAVRSDVVYLEDIKKLSSANKSPEEIYDEILFKDIRLAAQSFESLFDRTDGEMGYVSLELSPLYAHDMSKTVEEVRRIVSEVGAENVMIKVPATDEGIDAVRTLIAEGYNINVTLIFSVSQYEKVARAYIEGLKERRKNGFSVAGIKSTASVFMSRVDTLVDGMLLQIIESQGVSLEEKELAESLLGKASTVLGRLVYKRFLELFDSEDFSELEADGAWVQKPLWASTGTKNPSYSDVKYVEEHIYPDTVVTVPGKTLEAFRNHGNPQLSPLDFEDQESNLQKFLSLGIDLENVGRELLVDGEKKFVDSYVKIIDLIRDQI
jgi:transaldolase